MRLLGLDTSTRATAAAVLDTSAPAPEGGGHERRDDPIAVSGRPARPHHSARLLELALAAMADAGTDWDGIDRIAVGAGPGTFTGLRIGIAAAKGLATARGIPLVGVSTLQSLALIAAPAAAAAGADLVAGVIDARRGELFAAAWPIGTVADPAAAPVLPAAAYPPVALAAEIGRHRARILAVGDGAIPFRLHLEACGAIVPGDESVLHRVSAIGHCRLGTATPPSAAGAVSPAYLRLPDAELSRRSKP